MILELSCYLICEPVFNSGFHSAISIRSGNHERNGERKSFTRIFKNHFPLRNGMRKAKRPEVVEPGKGFKK